jgi:acyl carrier protein
MILNAQPVADQLAAFVRERFQISDSDADFTYDVHLWDQSYVDSIGVLEILAFLEDQFGVRIPEDALFEEDRASINGLAGLVTQLSTEVEDGKQLYVT